MSRKKLHLRTFAFRIPAQPSRTVRNHRLSPSFASSRKNAVCSSGQDAKNVAWPFAGARTQRRERRRSCPASSRSRAPRHDGALRSLRQTGVFPYPEHRSRFRNRGRSGPGDIPASLDPHPRLRCRSWRSRTLASRHCAQSRDRLRTFLPEPRRADLGGVRPRRPPRAVQRHGAGYSQRPACEAAEEGARKSFGESAQGNRTGLLRRSFANGDGGEAGRAARDHQDMDADGAARTARQAGGGSRGVTCDELRDEYEAFALGIAEDPERAGIIEHLAEQCPTCTHGVREAAAVVAAMSSLGHQTQPPRALRGRVLAMVGAPGGRGRLGVWLPWGLAVTLALVLAS